MRTSFEIIQDVKNLNLKLPPEIIRRRLDALAAELQEAFYECAQTNYHAGEEAGYKEGSKWLN